MYYIKFNNFDMITNYGLNKFWNFTKVAKSGSNIYGMGTVEFFLGISFAVKPGYPEFHMKLHFQTMLFPSKLLDWIAHFLKQN